MLAKMTKLYEMKDKIVTKFVSLNWNKNSNIIFERVKEWFKRHFAALFFGLLMATMVSLPLILFPIFNKDVYQGINTGNFGMDEYGYMARGKEILEGHRLGNPILNEGKSEENTSKDYAEYLFVLPTKLLNQENANIATIFYIWGFFGVFALVFLIYLFVLQLSGNRFLGIALSLFTTGAYTFFLPYLSRTATSPFSADLNMYGRPVEPLFGIILLFLLLNFILQLIRTSNKNWAFGAAIVFGLSFYVYFYTASYGVAFLTVLIIILALNKEWKLCGKTLVILVAGLGIGAYSICQSILASESEITTMFFGLIHSHNFYFSKIAFGTLILLAIFMWKERHHRNIYILLSIVLANWIAIDQQIITGAELQTMHYHLYFLIPTSIILYCYLGFELVKIRSLRIFCLTTAVIIAIGNTAYRQYQGYLATVEIKRYAQNYKPIVDFLNQDKKETTILASDKFYPMMFLVFTNHDLFWSHYATSFNTTLKRFRDAFFVYSYINKNARKNIETFYINAMDNETEKTKISHYLSRPEYYYDVLYSQLETLQYNIFDKTFKAGRDKSGNAIISGEMRQKFLENLNKEYKKITDSENGITDILKSDGVRYIVWDKVRQPEWDLSVIKGIKKVFSVNNIEIYSFK
jgi:hypothetical protein